MFIIGDNSVQTEPHMAKTGGKDALNPEAVGVDMSRMEDSTNTNGPRTLAPNLFCRSCGSPLVQATGWDQEEDSSWGVRLWCPECGFEQAAVLDRTQLLYLSVAVEEGFACMLEALAELNAASRAAANSSLVDRVLSDRIDPAGR